MSAATLPRNPDRDEGLGRPLAIAVGLHLLLAALLWLSNWFKWDHDVSAAGGGIEATMESSAAEDRAVERALNAEPVPLPEVVEPEPAEEDAVPPPQPLPEPVPEDSPAPLQTQAQEQIPVPDQIDQDEARADAISQEKAKQEQEAKRRQKQIDLTARQQQEDAERRQRLARQQEEELKKREAAEKLARIRAERAKNQAAMSQAEQRMQQIKDAAARRASSSNATQYGGQSTAATAGQGGTDDGLLAKYMAAIQSAVERQWVRPDSVTSGMRCKLIIKQIVGGEVIDAQVGSPCAMDAAGQESLKRAVMKAQPLPYRGFEDVFARQLNFTFTAD